jgi:hypothetical protein
VGDDPFKQSRDNAAGFGDAVEDALDDAGDAIRRLQGKDEEPEPERDHRGGDITININN